jgi:translation initiation factor IF-3
MGGKFGRRREPELARINTFIRVPEVRVVGVEGEMLGVMTVAEGIRLAQEAGVDLVEVSPNAVPPVCKLLDYGKFKYETQKKKNEAKKSQKIVQLKEIKLRPNIDVHDLETKKKAVTKFLAAGDKVKLTMRFRGREMAHIDIGRTILNQLTEFYKETSKIDMMPRMEGKQMIIILAPLAEK